MSQNTQVNPIVSKREPHSVLSEQIQRALEERQHEERSCKAKDGWQRRQERLYRASHNEAFIYVRSSDVEDVEDVEYQATLLKNKAAELGLECNQVFYDSCSGMKDPFVRPGFSKLMTALWAPPTVSKIVLLDPTRICRSRTGLSIVKRQLKELGVDMVYAKE